MTETRQQLIITGGWAHDFSRTAAHLGSVIDGAGFQSTVVDDLDEAARALDATTFDLVTVYACWFQMTDPRYDEKRSEWARSTPDELRRTLGAHIADGRGVLAMHTAPICFDDWPDWPGIVGGSWNWRRSWHPQPAPVQIELDLGTTAKPTVAHPIVAGIEPFQVFDERYTDLDLADDIDVLAWSVDGDRQPALWAHDVSGSRVVYDALGHDERSLDHPQHGVILRRSALWAAGADDAELADIH